MDRLRDEVLRRFKGAVVDDLRAMWEADNNVDIGDIDTAGEESRVEGGGVEEGRVGGGVVVNEEAEKEFRRCYAQELKIVEEARTVWPLVELLEGLGYSAWTILEILLVDALGFDDE